jgi:membrane protease YdiL (CAAX protease family)
MAVKVILLIVAPIIENAILVMLAYMLSSHIKRPLHLAVVTGVLSGLAHWTANGAINGLYSCVFFYLMARIYLRLLDIRKGWCGYGLTTAMHAVNNFFVFGLAAIISRFW